MGLVPGNRLPVATGASQCPARVGSCLHPLAGSRPPDPLGAQGLFLALQSHLCPGKLDSSMESSAASRACQAPVPFALEWQGQGGGEEMPFAQLLGHWARGAGRGSVLGVFSP